MKKVMNIIILALIGTGCFGAGLYYATKEFDESLDNVMNEYEVISDKVYAFEKVSDPKTIRKHVNELNKILDDIEFLHMLIESGQIADEKLDEYLATQQGNVDGLKESLLSITSEVDNMLDSSHTRIHGMVEELDSNVKTQLTNSTAEVMSKIDELNKQISSLQKTLNDVNQVVDKIKKSKLSKYLK